MSVEAFEAFSNWFSEQPDLIRRAVVYGPPMLVSALIVLALGGRIRFLILSWVFNPWLAGPLDAHRRETEEEAEAEWTHSARASVDEMIARRRRGIH